MNNNFSNYKEYCDGFERDDELSYLLMYLRDTLAGLDKRSEIGLIALCKDEINADTDWVDCDLLTCIVENFLPSIKHIIDNASTKLETKNVMMHASKAKKFSSSNINWLSRQSGNNVREKLASTNNKVMAQKRFNSYDTLENRLYKALCLRLDDYLSYKFAKLSKDNISLVE